MSPNEWENIQVLLKMTAPNSAAQSDKDLIQDLEALIKKYKDKIVTLEQVIFQVRLNSEGEYYNPLKEGP
tara:strand:- start:282 stop:491 length:210 start_codon:yes stop_codon:yes gene_type:complete